MTNDPLRAFADSIGTSTGKGAELADAIYLELQRKAYSGVAVPFVVAWGTEQPQSPRDCCG